MSNIEAREAAPDELETWDAHTVDVEGGNVHQSRAWASYQASVGWQPRFLVVGDRRVLVLEHGWPLLGGGYAYIPRGPVAAGDAATKVADRLAATTDYLAARGLDAVMSDAEIEAASGYAAALRSHGFQLTEEVQPSRHRMGLELAAGVEAESVFSQFSMTTRQRVRKGIKNGYRIVCWDPVAPADIESIVDVQREEAADPQRMEQVTQRFYDIVAGAATRRQFRLVSSKAFHELGDDGDRQPPGVSARGQIGR